MTIGNEAKSYVNKSGYGKLGLDVGFAGRWSRLLWGILILVPLSVEILQDLTSADVSLGFYGRAVLDFLAIAVAYTLVYWFLGEKLFAKANPWVNTAILVAPAFIVAWWDILVGPLTSVELPDALQLAMGVYIGISFILQWRIKYGGCEVVSLPILLLQRRYTTYCIPLVAIDAAEKAIVDRQSRAAQD